ncbi:MAG: carboxymuconolactone decarboxylase family protein [Pseudomonadota bacterium]
MPLINTIEPENAQGAVAEIYQEINEMFGFVPNAIKLDSINPEHMSRHWNAIKESVQHPSLSQKLFTIIRLMISEAQHCEYCIGLNAGMLIQMHGVSQEQIAEIGRDPAQAPLDEKEKALLLFVVKTVNDSNGTTAAEIEDLKAKGCSEREIFDTLAHGAQQAAGDIMLNAFKVEADMH